MTSDPWEGADSMMDVEKNAMTPRRRRPQAYRPRRDQIVFPVGMRRLSALGMTALVLWGALWVFLVVYMAATVLLP